MGRALEPGKRIPLYLDWDKDKPEATRPTFYTVSMSMRQQEDFQERYDKFLEEMEGDVAVGSSKWNAGLVDLLADCITDWSNQVDANTGQEIPYSKDSFVDVLANDEAHELINKARFYSRPSPDEKKSSGSGD